MEIPRKSPPSLTPEIVPEVLYSFIPFIAIGNGGIVLAFAFSTRLRRNNANYLVVAKASCDMLVALLLIPVLTSGSTISRHVMIYTLLVSLFILCVSTFDRYTSIALPFRYPEIVTERRIMLMIIGSWFIPLLIALLPFLWNRNLTSTAHRAYLGTISFGIIVAVLCMGFVFGDIFRIGRQHFSAITRLESIQSNSTQRYSVIMKRVGRELQFAKLFASVCLTFFIFWLPTGYMTIVDDVFWRPDLMPPSWIRNANFYWIFFSSMINPVFYTVFHQRLRRLMVNCCLCRLHRVSPQNLSVSH